MATTCRTLDELIAYLTAVRATLPRGGQSRVEVTDGDTVYSATVTTDETEDGDGPRGLVVFDLSAAEVLWAPGGTDGGWEFPSADAGR